MQKLLDKTSSLYETELRKAIQSKTDPKCYALFIPYYGIGMDAKDAAKFSLVGEFLGENWMSKANNSIEPSLCTWGEFISKGDEVRLKNTELQKYMLEWHIYLESIVTPCNWQPVGNVALNPEKEILLAASQLLQLP